MTQIPSEEQRGGDKPDWEKVVAYEPLPEQPDPWLERAQEILDEGKP